MELTRKSPRTETGTRTFSKGRVVLADDGTEIAVTVMSITTLSGFQKECQRQFEIVRKRRRNIVVFRRGEG